MNSDLSETFEKIFFFLLIISFFADMALRATWNKGYFVVGVPIFIKRIPVNVKHKGVPFQYLLEEKFQTGLFTSLAFKQMGPFTYVFREKYFQFIGIEYFPVMHGLLIFEREKHQVTVKGMAGWFAIFLAISLTIYIALVLMRLIAFFPLNFTNSFVVITLLLGLCYTVQCFRFSKVCSFAAELWLEKHYSKGERS
jgi:hypothetical protein